LPGKNNFNFKKRFTYAYVNKPEEVDDSYLEAEASKAYEKQIRKKQN
jgi:hypothetical protein